MTIETLATVEVEIDDLEVDELTIEDWEDKYLLENRSLDGFEEWLEEEKLPEWAWDHLLNAQGNNDLQMKISVGEAEYHG